MDTVWPDPSPAFISDGEQVTAAVANRSSEDVWNNVQHLESAGYFRVTPQDTPSNSVDVWPGIMRTTQQTLIDLATKTAEGTFAVVSSGKTRYDIVALNGAGVITTITGVEVVSPGDPFDDAPAVASHTPLAIIKVDETITVVIDTTDITDLRSIPATDGLRLNAQVSSDSALSAVTVGEVGCDFTTLELAIAYIGTLTSPNIDRQFTIKLFGKREGETYTIASEITIPAFTHLIGVGKPILTSTSDYYIILSAGATIRDVNLSGELSLRPSGVDSKVIDCSVDFDTDNNDPCIYATGNNVEIRNTQCDRGGISQPGIAGTADNVKVSGCTISNTGDESCIKGASGADDWLVRNNQLSTPSTLAIESFTNPSLITLNTSEGDLTALFSADRFLFVAGSANSENNGWHKVVSSAYVASKTEITVVTANIVNETVAATCVFQNTDSNGGTGWRMDRPVRTTWDLKNNIVYEATSDTWVTAWASGSTTSHGLTGYIGPTSPPTTEAAKAGAGESGEQTHILHFTFFVPRGYFWKVVTSGSASLNQHYAYSMSDS